jgi:tetratricopeptide (TPR) repeat protein
VQRTPPLEQVTTPSLEALRKYVEGTRLLSEREGLARGAQLLNDAIALDSGFAMAYRRLAIEYGNRRLRDQADRYYEMAFARRDRLTEPERYLLLGSYYQSSRHADAAKAREAYEQLLAIQPNNYGALNNLALISTEEHDYRAADTLTARALRVGPPLSPLFQNRAIALVDLGKLNEASATLDTFQMRLPNNPRALSFRADLFWVRRQYDSMAAVLDQLDRVSTDGADRTTARMLRASLARLHGRLRDARRYTYEAMEAADRAGDRGALLRAGLYEAADVAHLLGERERALRMIDTLLRRHRLDTLTGFVRREYKLLVTVYAMAGQAELARNAMIEWNAKRQAFRSSLDTLVLAGMDGYVDFASGRYQDAARKFRYGDSQGCTRCEAPIEGRAWELMGQPDSAITVYEKFLNTPALLRTEDDALYLTLVHERLGELYEAKGDRDRALRNYHTFLQLWKNADPELQPSVNTARQHVAALTRGTDRR